MTFTDVTRRRYVVEVTVSDLRGLRHDIERLLSADAATVSRWWRQLADGSDGRAKGGASCRHNSQDSRWMITNRPIAAHHAS